MTETALALGTTEVELRTLALDYAHLRARDAKAEALLAASLAELGQQHPLLVVARERPRRVVIDGYRRVRALRALGLDTAVVLELGASEADALAYCHRLATGRRRSALEEGWLVRELSSMGRPLARIAASLGRSTSWVSRRLGLATALPTSIDTAVREGRLSPHGAMRSLVPLARANKGHAETLVAALGRESITTRQLAALWSAYRIADAEQRARMLEKPLLWLRAKASVAPAPDEAAVLRDVNAATRALGRAHASLVSARSRDSNIALSPPVCRALRRAHDALGALSIEESHA